jgi:glutathione S-transferase
MSREEQQTNQEDASDKNPLVLTYFDVPGRGEPLRIALFMSGVAFDDDRVAWYQWQPALKAQLPLHQLPTLDVDDVRYTQSQALMRYAAQLGPSRLYPSGMDQLRCDEMMAIADELGSQLPQHSNSNTRRQLREDFVATTLHRGLTLIQKRYDAVGTGWCAGDDVSLGDLCVYSIVAWSLANSMWEYVDGNQLFLEFPVLAAVYAAVPAHERIRPYFDALAAE